MSNGLFISYRRADSAGVAGRIADYFRYRYPSVQVFFDAPSIAPGEDFVASIRAGLQASAVVLAPVGTEWLDVRDDENRRRIDNPEDFVRMELSLALQNGARIIPVLLDDAEMPAEDELPEDIRAFARCNAELMRHAAFARDVEHLGSFVFGFLDSSATDAVIPAAGTAPSDVVRERLVEAFETFRRETSGGGFVVCERLASIPHFVQFMRDSDDTVTLDLPLGQLNEDQVVAAQRLLWEDHNRTITSDDISFELELPLEPTYLAHMTLNVFENVFEVSEALSVRITIESQVEELDLPDIDIWADGHPPASEPIPALPSTAGREPPSAQEAGLAAAFAVFCRDASERGFMICEDDREQFVQFAHYGDWIDFELPTEPLSPSQIFAAEQVLVEGYGAEHREHTVLVDGQGWVPDDSGNFAYERRLPLDEWAMARLTVDVFDGVYGGVSADSVFTVSIHLDNESDTTVLTITVGATGVLESSEPLPGPASIAAGSEVEESLYAAFEQLSTAAPSDGPMSCMNGSNVLVQFLRADHGMVVLDMPIGEMNPKQIVAAMQVMEEHGARRNESPDGDFSFQLELPLDPLELTDFTLEIFETVYGSRPDTPPTMTFGKR